MKGVGEVGGDRCNGVVIDFFLVLVEIEEYFNIYRKVLGIVEI